MTALGVQGFAALSRDYPRSLLKTLTPAVCLSSALIISTTQILYYWRTVTVVGSYEEAKREWNFFFSHLHWYKKKYPFSAVTNNMQDRYTTYCIYTAAMPKIPLMHLPDFTYIQAWIKMPQDLLLWVLDQQKFVFINGVSNTFSNSALLNVPFLKYIITFSGHFIPTHAFNHDGTTFSLQIYYLKCTPVF